MSCAVLLLAPRYHWYVRFSPVASTRTMPTPPGAMDEPETALMTGRVQTVMIFALLSTVCPQVLVARQKYVVVADGETVSEGAVWPAMGSRSFGGSPRYHW